MPPRRHRSPAQRYFILWLKRHRKVVRKGIVLFLAFVGLLTLVQLAYPAGRLLPFVKVAGYSVGGQTARSAAKVVEGKYQKAVITVATDEKKYTQSLDEVGIELELTASTRAAARYTLTERFIPLSSLFIMVFRDTPLQVRLDQDRVRYFAQQIDKQSYIPAVNAAVAVTDGRVSLVSAKPSKSYPAADIVAQLQRQKYAPQNTVRIKPVIKDATRSNKQVANVLGDAQKTVDRALVLNIEGQKSVVPKATVGSWLDFPEDPKTMRLTLTLNPDEVKKYLATIQSKVYKASGKTTVHTVDGIEVSREVGASGQGIDMDKTVALLKEAVRRGNDAPISVPIAKLAPKVVYERQYSNSNAGFAAMLNDLASDKGSYGISVAGPNGRYASANGDKHFTTASTYKLYVAYAVFKKIETGELHWADEIANGQNAEVCFDLMIVKSDNACGEAFAKRIGWKTVQDLARSVGVSSNTSLATSDLYTTAKDLTLLLTKLQNGTLVSAADQARWIDAMKRQIYRAGIPAGTGVPVADKVGFLDGYLHDAAIVYGPKGPYIMVIMTQGSSWGQMADAARQIHAFMSQ
jgi:beta-lactamase class A